MSEIGVLVKLPAELHSEFKRASARHQRSMQKVVLALLEGWVTNGSPDPLTYGNHRADTGQGVLEDTGAREALMKVAIELKELSQRVAVIEKQQSLGRNSEFNFPAFYQALGEAEKISAADSTQES